MKFPVMLVRQSNQFKYALVFIFLNKYIYTYSATQKNCKSDKANRERNVYIIVK